MTETQQQQIDELTALEIQATERIAGWWKVADVLPHFPASSETVVELLSAMEYQVDLARIHKAIDGGWIACPLRKAGRFAWYALDIWAFQGALEVRRLWKPFTRLHDFKKSEFQRNIEAAEAAGKDPRAVIVDLDSFSVDDLLLLMVNCDAKPARELFFEAIKLKLADK